MKPKQKRLLTAFGSLSIAATTHFWAPTPVAAAPAETCSFGYCASCNDPGCGEVGCSQVGCIRNYCGGNMDYVVCG